MMPRAVHLRLLSGLALLAGLTLSACGGRSSSPPPRTSAPQALPPPQGPNPYALLAHFGPQAVEQVRAALATLPCPLPGLPPELVQLTDCSLLTAARSLPKVTVPVDPRLLPAQVDHRAMGLVGLRRDQGQVGSCTAHAVAAIFDTAARRAGRPQLNGSAMHIFAKYRAPGVEGFTEILRQPTTADVVWPYQPAKACLFDEEPLLSHCAHHYRIPKSSAYSIPAAMGELHYADRWPAFSLEKTENIDALRDLNQLAMLLAAGQALYVAVEMAYSWSRAGGFYGSVLPPPNGVLGPHAMVLRGYRYGPQGREWLVQNSWGIEWGEHGFAWMPEQSLRVTLLNVLRFQVRVLG